MLIPFSQVTLKDSYKADAPRILYEDGPLIFLSEISNMPQHGIFVTARGKVFTGLHIDQFEEIDNKVWQDVTEACNVWCDSSNKLWVIHEHSSFMRLLSDDYRLEKVAFAQKTQAVGQSVPIATATQWAFTVKKCK